MVSTITGSTAEGTIPVDQDTGSTVSCVRLRDLLEGQTAAQVVVAADDLGWWTALLDPSGRIRPETGTARAVAGALHSLGWIEPAPHGSYRITPEGQEIAVNRGFVRVVTRGWEPTFRILGEEATRADAIPARTDPGEIARGCTDIACRHPETMESIATRIRQDSSPGTTIDMGCAAAGRLQVIGELCPRELLAGVDIKAGVIDAAGARLDAAGLRDRVRLRTGSVQPLGSAPPPWLDRGLAESVTTVMSFFLLHQLASDGGGLVPVLRSWIEWFPHLRRLVIGDAVRAPGDRWADKPWFAPSYELYHQVTGVRLAYDEDYREAFAALGWREVERHDHEHPIFVTTVLER